MRKPEVIGYRRDGRPMLWMENLEDGDSIVCDSRQLRRASAWLARQRLRNVVVADRAAVPCGRWKPRVKGEFYPGRKGHLPFKVKPRWRWELRR